MLSYSFTNFSFFLTRPPEPSRLRLRKTHPADRTPPPTERHRRPSATADRAPLLTECDLAADRARLAVTGISLPQTCHQPRPAPRTCQRPPPHPADPAARNPRTLSRPATAAYVVEPDRTETAAIMHIASTVPSKSRHCDHRAFRAASLCPPTAIVASTKVKYIFIFY